MLKEPIRFDDEADYSKEALNRFHKVYGKQFGVSTLSKYETELTKLHQDILHQYQVCENNWDDSDSEEFDASGIAMDSVADDSSKINKIVHALKL